MQSTYYFCQILIKLEFSSQIFKKYSNINFHENMSSVSHVVLCRWTGVMKLIVASCNFGNARKNTSNGCKICHPRQPFGMPVLKLAL
jgi:hypothetical protein